MAWTLFPDAAPIVDYRCDLNFAICPLCTAKFSVDASLHSIIGNHKCSLPVLGLHRLVSSASNLQAAWGSRFVTVLRAENYVWTVRKTNSALMWVLLRVSMNEMNQVIIQDFGELQIAVNGVVSLMR